MTEPRSGLVWLNEMSTTDIDENGLITIFSTKILSKATLLSNFKCVIIKFMNSLLKLQTYKKV